MEAREARKSAAAEGAQDGSKQVRWLQLMASKGCQITCTLGVGLAEFLYLPAWRLRPTAVTLAVTLAAVMQPVCLASTLPYLLQSLYIMTTATRCSRRTCTKPNSAGSMLLVAGAGGVSLFTHAATPLIFDMCSCRTCTKPSQQATCCWSLVLAAAAALAAAVVVAVAAVQGCQA